MTTSRERPKNSTREPLLDLARIVACFIVVMHHAAIAVPYEHAEVPGSPAWTSIRIGVLNFLKFGTGTPIFFALAGFLVMGTLDRSEGDRAGIVRSFARRMRRIIPPYWLAMGMTAGLFLAMEAVGLKFLFSGGYALEFASPRDITKTQWLGNLALIETWRPLYSVEPGAIFTRVAWTLCYHEQFITFAMFVGILAGRKWRSWLVGSSIALMLFQVFLWDTGAFHRAEGLFVDRWFVFGCGLIAYDISQRPNHDRNKWMLTTLLVAGLAAGVRTGDIELKIAAATSLLLAFGTTWLGSMVSDDRAKQWAKLSPWTYPIFLMHLPAVTICNRIFVEMGIENFWGRTLLVVPISVASGIVAGIAFGRFVNYLDGVTIEKDHVVRVAQWLIAKSGLWPQRTWPAAEVLPVRSNPSGELPRQGRGTVPVLTTSSMSARRLSDRTPWPNAAQ